MIDKLKIGKYIGIGVSVLGIILLVFMGYVMWFMLNRLYIINPKFAALSIGMIFVLIILVTVIEMYDVWKVKETN